MNPDGMSWSEGGESLAAVGELVFGFALWPMSGAEYTILSGFCSEDAC